MLNLSRRELLAGSGAAGGAFALSGCASTSVLRGPATEAQAAALLDSIAENLL
jgi:hypothetical protein